MKSFKIIWSVCCNGFRKWKGNYRIWCIAILVLMITHMLTAEIRTFVSDIGIKVTPWIFPFLTGQKYNKLLFFFPLILLFCDAPFIDAGQPYNIIRSGKKNWCIGQILYIAISSGIYFFFLLFSSIILNIQSMVLDFDWGKILSSFAKTGIAGEINLKLVFSPRIIDYFTPLQAMFFSFLLLWIAGFFLGMVIFTLNIVSDTRSIGVLGAVSLLLFDATLNGSGFLLWFSPVSWCNLTNIRLGEGQTPNIEYVYTMYAVLLLVLVVISVTKFRKKAVLIRKELW